MFTMGFGVCEALQSMGNGYGLPMDGFSSHFEPHESISDDLHNFDRSFTKRVYFTAISPGAHPQSSRGKHSPGKKRFDFQISESSEEIVNFWISLAWNSWFP